MESVLEIPKAVRLKEPLIEDFEYDILQYGGTGRYVATWWSMDNQCVVWADGEAWRSDEINEDEWIWWVYTLAISNGFETNCLGFDFRFPSYVLLLDLQKREVWRAPIDATFDFLYDLPFQQEHQRAFEN
jgi:hypothetical protein